MPNEILYLCHNGVDYLQDGLYHGLVSLLGKSRVVDWPRQAHFHEPVRLTVPNLGFFPQAEPIRPRTNWGLRRQLRDGRFGIVVVAAGRKKAFAVWRDLMEACRQLPAVLVDGGDHIELAGQLAWERRVKLRKIVLSRRSFDLVFKRENRGQETNNPKILPITCCLPENYFEGEPSQTKKREVVFWAGASSASRAAAINKMRGVRDFDEAVVWGGSSFASRAAAINKMRGVREFDLNSDILFRDRAFLRELAATKVCLCFWGAGDDTLRFWEIPCVGSFLLAQKPRIPVPDNFIHRKEAVFVQDDLSDLVEQVNYYCDHDDEREAIARAGRDKFLKCHTTIARARYFLASLRERNLYHP